MSTEGGIKIRDYGNEHGEVRQTLEEKYGQVWSTTELQQDYYVEGFSAPYVVVRKKVTMEQGTLEFQHNPRFYYDFKKVS